MSLLIWLQPLVAAAALTLAGVTAAHGRVPRSAAVVHAAVVGLSALGLAVYVASDDDYRGTGISRWEAYDAKSLTVLAIVAGAVTAAGLYAAARRGRRGLATAAFLASGAAALLLFVAFLANSLN